MGIDKHQLRDLITRVLKRVPQFYSEDAVELLMLTAAVESDLGTYLTQVEGPALGLMQVEPETMRDNYGRYLYFRDRLKEEIRLACGVDRFDEDALEYNVAYSILMARLKYWRSPGPIPSDIEGMAKYHEKYYNAHEGNYASTGKEDWEVAVEKYRRFVD